MTMVDRQSACIVGHRVGFHRTEAVMQQMLDQAPQANVYYSDGLVTYGALFYAPGKHIKPERQEQNLHGRTGQWGVAPLSGSLGSAFALLFA